MQMSEVGAGVSFTDRTTARLVQGQGVGSPLRVLNVYLASGSESLSGSSISRRQNAVKHVNSMRHRLNQIFGRTDPHQIARLIRGQDRSKIANHAPHCTFFFADAQTTDGVTVKTNLRR